MLIQRKAELNQTARCPQRATLLQSGKCVRQPCVWCVVWQRVGQRVCAVRV